MIYFTAHTFKCVCHSIRTMFRVLGMYNFVLPLETWQPIISWCRSCTALEEYLPNLTPNGFAPFLCFYLWVLPHFCGMQELSLELLRRTYCTMVQQKSRSTNLSTNHNTMLQLRLQSCTVTCKRICKRSYDGSKERN